MKHQSFEQEKSSIMPEFTIGNYLATRLEQVGIKHYFMVPGEVPYRHGCANLPMRPARWR